MAEQITISTYVPKTYELDFDKIKTISDIIKGVHK